ncbi:MAG: GGDEF domain-containing protein [Leptospirales bacterium]|jgi:two-component system cell cycle response regulator
MSDSTQPENPQAEIRRLQQIVDAYEKLTMYSRDELLAADRTIQAHERVQHLSRDEIYRLHQTIDQLKAVEATLSERIKHALAEDSGNEELVLVELEELRRTSGENFYTDLFRVLVHYDFTSEEAQQHWQRILSHNDKLSQKLGRPVSFRVAMLDYFVGLNRILKSPKMIEIALFDEVVRSSLMDELTGLFNRRYFDRSLAREINRARRHDKPVALLVFDIDDFKKYNDRFGHAAGDNVLQQVGLLLRESLRSEDIPCRFGGEEFVAILPETTSHQASPLIERLIKRVAEAKLDHGKITVSGGVAHFPEQGREPGELFLQADRALYAAKAHGKNRICLAGEELK